MAVNIMTIYHLNQYFISMKVLQGNVLLTYFSN